jgi:hypothetical protein
MTKPNDDGAVLALGTSVQATTALTEERKEGDDDLRRERALVDHTVYQLQHDGKIEPMVRRALGELRRRLRRHRGLADDLRADTREITDTAIVREQRTTTDDLSRAFHAREDAESTLRLQRVDVQRSLWATLAELDVIASAAQAIRLRSAGLPTERDLSDLANAISVASGRVLELVGDLLDPEDNRSLYHDEGASG